MVTLDLHAFRLRFGRMMAALLPALLAFGSRINAAPNARGANASSAPILLDQIGTVAGKHYSGDGVCLSGTIDGARLRCAFQKLEGEVTREGLWLTSTAGESASERFRVVATAVGRAMVLRTGIPSLSPLEAITVIPRQNSKAAISVTVRSNCPRDTGIVIQGGFVRESTS